MPRPVWLVLLLMLPAAIAAIGAWRSSRVLLIAAGCLCLAQSFLAFSGATLPFIVPAIVLLSLGGGSNGERATRPVLAASIALVALGIGAWVALFASAETLCWVAREAADGRLVYSFVPVSDTQTVGVGDIAAGCDGGSISIQGLALAGILGIGAIGLAEVSSRRAGQVVGSGTNGPSAVATATKSGEP